MKYLVLIGGRAFVRDWTLPPGACATPLTLDVGGRRVACKGLRLAAPIPEPLEPAGKSVRFIPDGADEPPQKPPDEAITESDLEQAAALWDELMPEYRGLLKSPIVNKQGPQDAH